MALGKHDILQPPNDLLLRVKEMAMPSRQTGPTQRELRGTGKRVNSKSISTHKLSLHTKISSARVLVFKLIYQFSC